MVVCSESDERRAAVAAQLEERYSATYEVVSVATSSEGADALAAASRDDRQVAILLADDPGELDDGHTVFQVAARLFPDARRGLLVEWGAWGDRDTADLVLTLMGRGQIDYYVIRPWHSPDEYFHRTITEFLSEWDRAVGLRPREVSVLGDPASPRSHEIRRLLAHNGIPHGFVPTTAPEAGELLARAGVPGGRVHRRPPPRPPGPRRPDERRAGGRLRSGRRRAGQVELRPRRHRCRAGRAGGRRLRVVRGGAHARRGARVDRRAGGVQLVDPQLPRVRTRCLGSRARPACLPAGVGVRLLLRALTGCGVARHRRRGFRRGYRAGSHGARLVGGAGHRCVVPPAGGDRAPALRVDRRPLRRLGIRGEGPEGRTWPSSSEVATRRARPH